ncbi:MAG: (Fe-S)-binding protein [Bacilli bacterium]|jgi:Na+-translocating ferredoxin:NAD+ oxidoreductase RNF subunit RnfB|nr:(Fe-S)-binding protein [Bacilli bacterium]
MTGVLLITLSSFIISIILSLVYFYLFKNDKAIEEIVKMLPGYNCNVCGYGSCQGMATNALTTLEALPKCKFLKADQIKKITTYLKKS